MAFGFHISTSSRWPTSTTAIPHLEIDCSHYKDRHRWSLPGATISSEFFVPNDVAFDLKASIEFEGTTVEYSYEGLRNGDHLMVFAIDPYNYMSSIFHDQQVSQVRQCVATCADGSSSPGCVICSVGGLTVKVCC